MTHRERPPSPAAVSRRSPDAVRTRGGATTMELTRRDLLKGAAALGAAATVPLTAPGAALAQTTQKKELVTAQAGDISKFDPHFSTSSNDIRVSFNVFDNLTSRHPDGKLHPGLATEWKLEGPDHVALQAAPGRQVPQRRRLHVGRRQVQHRAHLRPGRQDHGGHRARHDRADRGAGSLHARHPPPRSRTRCCPRAWRSTAARSCRRSTSRRSATTPSMPSRSARARCASAPG